MPIINTTTAYDNGALTVADTAVGLADFTGLDAAAVLQAQRIRLTVNSNALRYFYDGATPTTTSGHLIPTNGTIEIIGNQNIQQLLVIRDGGSSAAVVVTLER